MKKLIIVFVLIYSSIFYAQEKKAPEQSDVEIRGQAKVSDHEILKRLPADFHDLMKIDLSIEGNKKIKQEWKGRILVDHGKYILSMNDFGLTGCKELGLRVLCFHSKRFGDVYEFINAFHCVEAGIDIKYYIFNDKGNTKLGANELFNQWSVAIHEPEVNRDIRGHQYGEFWVIPGDEGYVDDSPSISFIYDRFFITLWIAGQGPEKLDLLDKYALKALKKIKIGLGEIVAEQ
jgi:hypothetical protein